MGADAVKLLAQFEPTEPHLRRAPVPTDRACLQRVPEARHPPAARNRGVPVRRREEDRRQLPEPQGRRRSSSRPASSAGSATSTRRSSPARWATTPTSQLRDNLQALDAASERPWVLLSAGVDYPDYFKQVQMAMECGRLGRPGWPGILEGVLPSGWRGRRSQFAATTAFKRVADVEHRRSRTRNSLVWPLWSDPRRPRLDSGHRGLARPLWNPPGCHARERRRKGRAGRSLLITGLVRSGHIGQPSLGKYTKREGDLGRCVFERRPWLPLAITQIDRRKGGRDPVEGPSRWCKRWRINKHSTVDN